MLVHELRAVISPPTSEVKLKLGLISSDENMLIHSLGAEQRALWRSGCVVGNSEVNRPLGLGVDFRGNGKGILVRTKQKELKLTHYFGVDVLTLTGGVMISAHYPSI